MACDNCFRGTLLIAGSLSAGRLLASFLNAVKNPPLIIPTKHLGKAGRKAHWKL